MARKMYFYIFNTELKSNFTHSHALFLTVEKLSNFEPIKVNFLQYWTAIKELF